MTTMKRASRVLVSAVAGLLIGAGSAAAQGSNFVAPATADPQAAAGWSLTPSIGYSGAWDDNVLVRGNGDLPATQTAAAGTSGTGLKSVTLAASSPA